MNVFRSFKRNLRIIWIGILVLKYHIFHILNWSLGTYLVSTLCTFSLLATCFLDCNFCVRGLGIRYKWEGMLYTDMYIKRTAGVLLCVIIRKTLHVCGKYGVFSPWNVCAIIYETFDSKLIEACKTKWNVGVSLFDSEEMVGAWNVLNPFFFSFFLHILTNKYIYK